MPRPPPAAPAGAGADCRCPNNGWCTLDLPMYSIKHVSQAGACGFKVSKWSCHCRRGQGRACQRGCERSCVPVLCRERCHIALCDVQLQPGPCEGRGSLVDPRRPTPPAPAAPPAWHAAQVAPLLPLQTSPASLDPQLLTFSPPALAAVPRRRASLRPPASALSRIPTAS